ncbi:hypothetical protein CGC54_06670 [Capnocytophaga canimorsus]|uniref:Uncharacterized protein n=1 Tax=Capnocytophaga canimorsus TaxID=28188 RepID=A0AAC9Z335_9FLAO|nr:hypothetical protein [Capnocytophaga canimorsus]ATA94034.1 hypothetical protein CGC54_06670 [Capnocytophaga canimorsus]
MFKRLNVSLITNEYKKSFVVDGKLRFCDKFLFFIFPYLFAIILCFIKIPEDNLKNLLGTSLSIFIGLFFNVLILLASQTNQIKSSLNFTEQNLRLEIIQDTLYNILYALLQSVNALIILYFMSIITLDDTFLQRFYFALFQRDINLDIMFFLTFLLYKFITSLVLCFYIMIKNIIALFQKEINMEKLSIRNRLQKVKEGINYTSEDIS